MPDLSSMKTLALIAKKGSLASVARALGVSAAAVSKQLQRLENELGVSLLNRSTRKIEFTDIGRQYCAQCQRVLEEAEEADALISHIKASPKGLLKVVSGRHFGSSYIVPHLKEFLLRYPEISLTLELAERIPDLATEALDISIGMSVSATGEAIQKRIASTRYVLCASPAYLQEKGTPKKPQDLLHHRYITHSMRKPDDEATFGKKETIRLAPYVRVNDTEAMLTLAKEGLGIVKLHDYVVKDALRQGALVELLSSYAEAPIPLYAAFLQRRYISPKIRCFIDFIADKINKA